MAVFCPYCANLLITQMELDDGLKFICQTCPYQFPIEKKLVRYVPLVSCLGPIHNLTCEFRDQRKQ